MKYNYAILTVYPIHVMQHMYFFIVIDPEVDS